MIAPKCSYLLCTFLYYVTNDNKIRVGRCKCKMSVAFKRYRSRTSTLFSFSVNFAGLTTYQDQGLNNFQNVYYESRG